MIVLRRMFSNEDDSSKGEGKNAARYIGSGIAGAGIITSLSTIPGMNNMKKQSRKKFEPKFEKEYFNPNSIGYSKEDYDAYNKLKNKSKSLVRARFTLSNENLFNPGAGHIDNWRKTAEKSYGPDLWMKDDGKRINKNLLTEDNLFDAKNDLDLNFSKEKWEEFKELSKKFLKDKTDSIIKEGKKKELDKFRSDKIRALKRLKNLRKIRNLGLATAGVGTGIVLGNELIKNKNKKSKVIK